MRSNLLLFLIYSLLFFSFPHHAGEESFDSSKGKFSLTTSSSDTLLLEKRSRIQSHRTFRPWPLRFLFFKESPLLPFSHSLRVSQALSFNFRYCPYTRSPLVFNEILRI